MMGRLKSEPGQLFYQFNLADALAVENCQLPCFAGIAGRTSARRVQTPQIEPAAMIWSGVPFEAFDRAPDA